VSECESGCVSLMWRIGMEKGTEIASQTGANAATGIAKLNTFGFWIVLEVVMAFGILTVSYTDFVGRRFRRRHRSSAPPARGGLTGSAR